MTWGFAGNSEDWYDGVYQTYPQQERDTMIDREWEQIPEDVQIKMEEYLDHQDTAKRVAKRYKRGLFPKVFSYSVFSGEGYAGWETERNKIHLKGGVFIQVDSWMTGRGMSAYRLGVYHPGYDLEFLYSELPEYTLEQAQLLQKKLVNDLARIIEEYADSPKEQIKKSMDQFKKDWTQFKSKNHLSRKYSYVQEEKARDARVKDILRE